MKQTTNDPKVEPMNEPTQQPGLPLSLALIAAGNPPPSPIAWSAIKHELKPYLKDLQTRKEAHRDNKVATLKKWKAKAGMLEKKRMAGLAADADEHDQVHAASVPAHIMRHFREVESGFESEGLFIQEKPKKLRALGFSDEDVAWVWSRKTDENEESNDSFRTTLES
ncbi:hypothetical protein PMIN06_003238 [Paraphaeosphaeria minitans]|uniref:Uncharacterized protein n=1 Tax=Paraphaeosphaeria minitans TaxID=565426 RepID=A0A9P6G5V0_9PLEO|nr:hypothetical protein PMIN01_12511 [Paraphaeosphaeria minitans]